MRVRRLYVILGLLAVSPALAEESWREVTGEAFSFTEVSEGVWHLRGTGAVAVGSNGALIVAEDDALLVDSHMSPAAARALLADLPRVTDKPIRYVVNTHFHFDHVQGNQVFGPGVEIVAHDFTREQVANGGTRRGRGYDSFVGTVPARIEALEAEVEEAEGERRTEIEEVLAGTRVFWANDQETELVPPTMTLRQAVTLFRGGREIRILHLGRGHTGGDVVVYLPSERVLVTGDLVTEGVPYMGDAFLHEWADTLELVKGLDIAVVLPGHGAAFEGAERIGFLQELLRDLWSQASDLHAQGVSAADAVGRIDLTAHAEIYPSLEAPLGTSPLARHAVDRIYEVLEE